MSKLSVCIPTYNRAAFIGGTLLSILNQVSRDIEICISDNGSTDNTLEVIRQTLFSFPDVKVSIYAANENRGADWNYLNVVNMSTAEYCIILGSDDELIPGSINEILKDLSNDEPDVVLYERVVCTIEMAEIRRENYLELKNDRDWLHTKPADLDDYFKYAISLCSAFTYISSIVFRRAVWDSISTDMHSKWLGSGYVHSYKLIQACIFGLHLRYKAHALVYCRLGNDSFRERGLPKRVELDVDGLTRLSQLLREGGAIQASHKVVTLLAIEYPFWRLVRYQSLLSNNKEWQSVLSRFSDEDIYSAVTIYIARLLGQVPGVGRCSFFARDFYNFIWKKVRRFSKEV
jgi:abequosyltransferase